MSHTINKYVPVYIYIVLLMVLLPLASQISAQSFVPSSDIIISFTPKYPSSGDEVVLKARSLEFNATLANFKWFLNGKLVSSGAGLTEQTFTAGKVGSLMNIQVVATTQNNATYENAVTLPVTDIDFVIHPLTYVPPYYRGSSLPTPDSSVEVFAVPFLFSNSTRLSPSNLLYEWFVDGASVQNQSGIGKNKLTLHLSDTKNSEYEVSLKVSSLAIGVVSQKNTRIKTSDPEILFYETSPLTGVNPHAFTSFQIVSGKELSVLTEPYFFDLKSLQGATIEWATGGTNIPPGDNPRLLNIASLPDTETSIFFSFNIEGLGSIFQRAEGALTITSLGF